MISAIITGVIKRVGFPLAILCLLSIWGKKRAREKIVLFSIVLLGLLWRMIYSVGHTFSSRYCIIFVLFAIILSVISLEKLPNTLSIILVAAIVIYQLYESYNDYNKKYIYDAREYLDKLANSSPAHIMVQEKEYWRINDSTDKYEIINNGIESEKDFNQILDYYDFRGHNNYVATYDKRTKEQNTNPSIKILSKSKSGKQNINYFTIFSIDAPERDNHSHVLESTNNLITNGNFEEIEKKDISKRKLKKWIDAGCDFYDSDLLILPQNEILLPLAETPQSNKYPKVYLSSENPIEGSLSLFVEFQDKGCVYFLNWIEKKGGCLSFKIQSLDSKTHVTVSENIYLRDPISHGYRYENSFKIKELFISDNDVHQISIVIPVRDNNERYSLFFIKGNNTSFLLDELSYYYLQGQ